MNAQHRFSLIALTAILAASCDRPRQSDVTDVSVRQAHRFDGECASWLYSHSTGFKYCASPPFKAELPAHELAMSIVEEAVTDGPVTEEALSETGAKVYGKICVACHMEDGKGAAGVFPPLAGAGGYYGDPQNQARIIVHGLSGEIEVLGTAYNGAMPPQAQLSDYEVAAVATFVRTSWGNSDGIVTPDDVKAIR